MKWVAIFVAALAVGGLGFVVGQRVALQETASPDASRTVAPGSDASQPLHPILAIPDAHERATRLVAFFSPRGPEDLEAVRTALLEARHDVDPIAYLLFADWWARFDPAAAFADAGRWPLFDRDLGVAAVVAAWARHDVDAARAAVESIPGEERRQRCIQSLVAGWQDSGREGLVEYIQRLPKGAFQQKALDVFMARMASRDGIDAVERFAEAQPDKGPRRFKLQVFRRAVTAVAAYDPARAGEWAARHADGPFGDGLLRRAGSAWATRDPQAAMAWVVGLPSLRGREEAVRETYRVWLSRERAAALEWMRTATPSPSLDPAMSLGAAAMVRDDPETGLAWLGRIEDEATREKGMIMLARVWMNFDREAAVAWLADAPIPDDVKETIRNSRLRGRKRAPRPEPAAAAAGEQQGAPAEGAH